MAVLDTNTLASGVIAERGAYAEVTIVSPRVFLDHLQMQEGEG